MCTVVAWKQKFLMNILAMNILIHIRIYVYIYKTEKPHGLFFVVGKSLGKYINVCVRVEVVSSNEQNNH
jgi:hypothetical protein